MKETTIEQKFCRKLVEWARDNGESVKILKLNVQGRRGWPDRMVLWTGPNTLFVEFKRPGQHSRNLQIFVQDGLKEMGFDVTEQDNTEEALEYVKNAIINARKAKELVVL